MFLQHAFREKLGNDFFLRRAVIEEGASAKPVFFIGKERIQRNHGVCPGHVSGNVIRVGDTDIRRGAGGDIGDHIVENPAVVGVEFHIDLDVGIERLKISDGFFVDIGLVFVGIVLCPEGDLIFLGGI